MATDPTTGVGPRHTNRLAKETSPYLLQHAHNPVDWYPWGQEAFDVARREDRPIFLSVGYSTCYWCHVMERQSFENEAIAAEMNRRFVNIKVDREERPDVDQLYMTAVQVLTRHGGWPMSVFLTPDLRPFYGGTYFPATDAHGRIGFPRLLQEIERAYRERRADVEQSASQLVDILRQLAEPEPPRRAVVLDQEFVETLVARSASDYDREHGGFGRAPKFPRQTLLELLLAYVDTPAGGADAGPDGQRRRERVMKILLHTFDAMADGGIRDHLGGGFHRYSTDERWLVPHFEIMLYDNAMLGWCYAELHRQTRDDRYAKVARGIFDFVLREMTSPDGAFYTAFDAEVDAQEGLSYLWTAEEIEEVLGAEDARLFNRVYGVDEGPNFADPHHGTGQPDRNILFLPEPLETVAARQKMTEEELEGRLAPMRVMLLEARGRRKQPLLDTKVLTSWNALMIRALAHGGRVLQDDRYMLAAGRAADYLLRQHRMADGGLYRTSRNGAAQYAGFLDDYAFLVRALLALRDATGREEWKDHAAAVAVAMSDKFGDDRHGGFYFSEAGAVDLVVRQKVASDSPLPSGNAAAAIAMMALGKPAEAERVLRAFAGQMEQQGEGMSALVEAALAYLRDHPPVRVEAGPGDDEQRDDRPLSPMDVAEGVVSVETKWATPRQLDVRLSVLDGFHVNANEASEGLVATTVRVMGDAAEQVERVDYPPGELRAFAFAEQGIRVYEGAVLVVVRFKPGAEAVGPVKLAVTYQACDEDACLPPVVKEVTAGAV